MQDNFLVLLRLQPNNFFALLVVKPELELNLLRQTHVLTKTICQLDHGLPLRIVCFEMLVY